MRCSASDTPSCLMPLPTRPHASCSCPPPPPQARRLQTELDELQRRLASQPLAPPAPHGAAEDEGEAAVTQALQNVELVMREEEQASAAAAVHRRCKPSPSPSTPPPSAPPNPTPAMPPFESRHSRQRAYPSPTPPPPPPPSQEREWTRRAVRAAEAHEVAHDMAPGGAIAMAAPLPGDMPHVWMCIAIPRDVSAGESVLIDTPHGTPLRPYATLQPSSAPPPLRPSAPPPLRPSAPPPLRPSAPPPLRPSAPRGRRHAR
jgi:hypothetical protein